MTFKNVIFSILLVTITPNLLASEIVDRCDAEPTPSLIHREAESTTAHQASSSSDDSQEITRNVCHWEIFNATCHDASEVVVIQTALYGRMRGINRCIKDSYPQDGCAVDVHRYLDHLCSGRRTCSLQVPDPVLDKSPHGCGEVRSFMEVTYHCRKVTLPESLQCKVSQPVKLPPGSGFISSLVTSEFSVGSAACPYLIEVDSVQTITITLIDFGLWSGAGFGRPASSGICVKYATIRDGTPSGKEELICGGLEGARETRVFQSTSNKVYVNILVDENPSSHFLLKYEANGCKDYTPEEGMKVTKVGDQTLRVGCKSGGGFEVDVECIGSQWKPLGNLPNCSDSGGAGGWWTLGASSLTHQGLLIVILISVALLVVIIILTIGICCLCHFKVRDQTRLTNESFDPITGRYATASHPNELKELYPMLLKQDREPMDWGRDYATTLQMRQMAHPNMHPSTPDQFFSPQFHHYPQNAPTNCCYCPVHGPACSESIARGRTSSFRPHSEHIYEVPRFETEAYEEDDNIGPRPTVYHELNNQHRHNMADVSFIPSHDISRNPSHSSSHNIMDIQPVDCSAVGNNSHSSLLSSPDNSLSARASSLPPYRGEVQANLSEDLRNKN